MAYGRAVLKWDPPLDALRDGRKQGRIHTPVIIRAVMAMCFCRLGSLNALAQSRPRRVWRRWLGQELPSPDTLGRVATLVDVQGVRDPGHHLYERLKRNKALRPPPHGLIALVLDGHETHATYKRHCPGCLRRTIQTKQGERIQYYHRLVAASLVTQDVQFRLDAEPIRPGEDEVAVALRLLDRIVEAYPRAFDLVCGDALYADQRFFNWAVSHRKDAMAVLKQERRDLFQDAQRLFEDQPPSSLREGNVLRQTWDLEGFTTWPQVRVPVRVIRSRETRSIRSQLDRQVHPEVTEWYGVTTLPQARASTGAAVQIGHHRWTIENQGFNERVNRHHADHVYRHESTAMLVFWLLTALCLNVFLAFFLRNLKPAARRAVSMLHVGRLIQADLYAPLVRAPP